MTPADLRAGLALELRRLRAASARLEAVDDQLSQLRAELQPRIRRLRAEAVQPRAAAVVQLRSAQAQAAAELARQAALGEVLAHSGRLSLISAMAVRRWLTALTQLSAPGAPEASIRAHIEAGRIAHRCLVSLRPRAQLRSGLGLLTAAVVVSSFVHEDRRAYLDAELRRGLDRATRVGGCEDAVEAAAGVRRALQAGTELMNRLADRAAPAAQALVARAEGLEERVERDLRAAR